MTADGTSAPNGCSAPDVRDEYLPESIRRFTDSCTVLDPKNPHKSITQGGSHHGSHPYMGA